MVVVILMVVVMVMVMVMAMVMVMVKLSAPLQSAPLLVSSSPLVLGSIDLAPGVAEEQAFLDWVGGNTVLEGSQPMAHRWVGDIVVTEGSGCTRSTRSTKEHIFKHIFKKEHTCVLLNRHVFLTHVT